ncbi:MAG: riboflavin synthase [Bdellovibrionaceae bacterium]|nr:riboflavin synthase [Pseudobdellovibrionaceae bacterium]
MFTGIVETTQKITHIEEKDQTLVVYVSKPDSFNDLHVGDSIALNGVCLTVENFENDLVFTLGVETLKIMNWTKDNLLGRVVNLERSLRFGDRIHGHLVSGHADGTLPLIRRQPAGDCLILEFNLPNEFRMYFWKKGSITLNGVSLTLNDIDIDSFSVCLIPETLRKTNLEHVKIGERVSFECDYFMKGFLNARKYEGADVGF